MNSAALVVHSFSYPFIKNVALFIHKAIQTHFDSNAELLICDTVDEAEHGENTTVFLIGENFKPFNRRPGCTYVYLNFSVVTVLGRFWETGLKARLAIRSKLKRLSGHLRSVDILLDYYPPQTKVLQRKLKIPVLGFDVATSLQQEFVPMKDRQYDVCFVGGLNKRRQSVCDAIRASGMSLSPSEGIAIEDAAAQSRVCLNVHSVKSHHLETPRFVAALSAGTPIVTEPSFGAHTVVDRRFVTEKNCAQLPSTVDELLHAGKLEALGQGARRWYGDTYIPCAQANWRETCRAIRAIVVK